MRPSSPPSPILFARNSSSTPRIRYRNPTRLADKLKRPSFDAASIQLTRKRRVEHPLEITLSVRLGDQRSIQIDIDAGGRFEPPKTRPLHPFETWLFHASPICKLFSLHLA